MTTDYTDQRRQCANHLYHVQHGHYVLCEAATDLFGNPIIGGGYRDIRPISYSEALTLHLAPGQALRHVTGERT